MIIDKEAENFYWLQNIVACECIVKDMNSILDLNLLSAPEKLQKLVLNPSLVLPPDMLEIVLNKFFALKAITMYMHERLTLQSEIHRAGSTLTLLQKTEKSLQILGDRGKIKSINITFDIYHWLLRWKIEFSSRAYSRNQKIMNLESVSIKYCLAPKVISKFWLNMLSFQRNLKYFVCDFGATHWNTYSEIVIQNKYTLESIRLSNLTCWDEKKEEEIPFKFDIFRNCRRLRHIKMSCDLDMGNTILAPCYIPVEHTQELVELESLKTIELDKFFLTQSDLRFLRVLAGLERFEKCVCKHCDVNGTVISLELHSPEISSLLVHSASNTYFEELKNDLWDLETDSFPEMLEKKLEEFNEMDRNKHKSAFGLAQAVACMHILIFTAWVILC